MEKRQPPPIDHSETALRKRKMEELSDKLNSPEPFPGDVNKITTTKKLTMYQQWKRDINPASALNNVYYTDPRELDAIPGETPDSKPFQYVMRWLPNGGKGQSLSVLKRVAKTFHNYITALYESEAPNALETMEYFTKLYDTWMRANERFADSNEYAPLLPTTEQELEDAKKPWFNIKFLLEAVRDVFEKTADTDENRRTLEKTQQLRERPLDSNENSQTLDSQNNSQSTHVFDSPSLMHSLYGDIKRTGDEFVNSSKTFSKTLPPEESLFHTFFLPGQQSFESLNPVTPFSNMDLLSSLQGKSEWRNPKTGEKTVVYKLCQANDLAVITYVNMRRAVIGGTNLVKTCSKTGVNYLMTKDVLYSPDAGYRYIKRKETMRGRGHDKYMEVTETCAIRKISDVFKDNPELNLWYTGLCFKPTLRRDLAPQGYFNLFRGFMHSQVNNPAFDELHPNYKELYDKVDIGIFIEHWKNRVCYDTDPKMMFEKQRHLFAKMHFSVARVEERICQITYVEGMPGTGKSSWALAWVAMMGEQYCVQFLGGVAFQSKFNKSQYEGTLLAIVDECAEAKNALVANKGQKVSIDSDTKGMVTEDFTWVERKNVQAYKIELHHQLVMLTDQMGSLRLETQDRRTRIFTMKPLPLDPVELKKLKSDLFYMRSVLKDPILKNVLGAKLFDYFVGTFPYDHHFYGEGEQYDRSWLETYDIEAFLKCERRRELIIGGMDAPVAFFVDRYKELAHKYFNKSDRELKNLYLPIEYVLDPEDEKYAYIRAESVFTKFKDSDEISPQLKKTIDLPLFLNVIAAQLKIVAKNVRVEHCHLPGESNGKPFTWKKKSFKILRDFDEWFDGMF